MIPILETKELKDAKADIASGLESLMKRAIAKTKTPEEQEAERKAEIQAARDAALVRALQINNSFWWIFEEHDPTGLLGTAYHDRDWRAGGLGWWRIVGHDPTVFEMFQQMDDAHRARYLVRMRAAPLPPTVHPMQLSDPITGEYRHVAA